MTDTNDENIIDIKKNEENTTSLQSDNKPFSVDFSTTFKMENPIKNGTIQSANLNSNFYELMPFQIYKPRLYEFTDVTPDGASCTYGGLTEGGPDPITSFHKFDVDGKEYEFSHEVPATEILFSNRYNTTQNDFLEKPIITLDGLRDFHNQNGQSTDKTYDYLKSFINENKDDKETIKLFVSKFLSDLVEHYDNNKSHAGVGEQKEILSKLMQAEDKSEIGGFICGPIHEFMMRTLNECGIEAAIVAGEQTGGNHATLIWKADNGEYVFNNYGTNLTIEASNIIDAVKEAEKSSYDFSSSGNITIYDGNNSYVEYAFTDSAYHGEEMDKRYYNKDNPFNQTFADRTSFTGNIEVSNLGNMTLDTKATIIKNNDNKKSQLDISLGAVKKGESSMFNESLSIGSEVGYQKAKVDGDTTTYTNLTGIASYIKGTSYSTDYTFNPLITNANRNRSIAEIEDLNNFLNSDAYLQLTEAERKLIDPQIKSKLLSETNFLEYNPEGKIYKSRQTNTSNHLSVFGRGVWGKNHKMLETDSFTLNSGVELSGSFNATNKLGTSSFNGDFRVGAEGGFQLTNGSDSHLWQTNVSGGIFSDFNPQHVTTNLDLINLGAKFNLGSGVSYSPSPSTTLGIRGDMSTTASASATDWNLEGNIYGSYTAENGTRFTAMSGVEYETQRLTMNHINERTKNNTTFNVLLSGEKGNTTVYAGYSQHLDSMNKSRNNYSANIGIKYNF